MKQWIGLLAIASIYATDAWSATPPETLALTPALVAGIRSPGRIREQGISIRLRLPRRCLRRQFTAHSATPDAIVLSVPRFSVRI